MTKRILWCEDRPALYETVETLFAPQNPDLWEFKALPSSDEVSTYLKTQNVTFDAVIVDDLMPSCDQWPPEVTADGLETGVRIAETIGENYSHNKTLFVSYSLHQNTFEFYEQMRKQNRFKRMLKVDYSPYDVEEYVLKFLRELDV